MDKLVCAQPPLKGQLDEAVTIETDMLAGFRRATIEATARTPVTKRIDRDLEELCRLFDRQYWCGNFSA